MITLYERDQRTTSNIETKAGHVTKAIQDDEGTFFIYTDTNHILTITDDDFDLLATVYIEGKSFTRDQYDQYIEEEYA